MLSQLHTNFFTIPKYNVMKIGTPHVKYSKRFHLIQFCNIVLCQLGPSGPFLLVLTFKQQLPLF